MVRELRRIKEGSGLPHLDSNVVYTALSAESDDLVSDERVKIDFKGKKWIGCGAEGDIYKVKVVCDGVEKWCVLKQLRKPKVHDGRTIHEILTSEDATTSTHNIIKFMGNVFHEGVHYTLMPYCEMFLADKRPLFYKMAVSDPEVYEAMVIRLMLDMLDGLDYMHSLGMVHRDVKPENIAYHLGHWCLVDLDCASAMNVKASSAEEPIGTAYYMHPACFDDEAQSTQSFNDLYALGNVLKVLLSEQFYDELFTKIPIVHMARGLIKYQAQQAIAAEVVDLDALQNELRSCPMRVRLAKIADYMTRLRPDERMSARLLKGWFREMFASIAEPIRERAQFEFEAMIDEAESGVSTAPSSLPIPSGSLVAGGPGFFQPAELPPQSLSGTLSLTSSLDSSDEGQLDPPQQDKKQESNSTSRATC